MEHEKRQHGRFWFFFFEGEEPGRREALRRLVGALRKRLVEGYAEAGETYWDPDIAYRLKVRVSNSCFTKKEKKRDGTTREVSRQGGLVDFHGLRRDIRFWVVGYCLHIDYPDHDSYMVLLRFNDGVFQMARVNLYREKGREEEYNVAFYPGYYSEAIETRFYFIDENVKREFRQLPRV